MKKVIPINSQDLPQTFKLGESSELSQFQILQILQNKEYYLNIWRNIKFTGDKSNYMLYEKFIIKDNENWDTLSYKLYGTVHYWWILAFFNDILNPFENLYNGQEIIILKQTYIPIFLEIFKKEGQR